MQVCLYLSCWKPAEPAWSTELYNGLTMCVQHSSHSPSLLKTEAQTVGLTLCLLQRGTKPTGSVSDICPKTKQIPFLNAMDGLKKKKNELNIRSLNINLD